MEKSPKNARHRRSSDPSWKKLPTPPPDPTSSRFDKTEQLSEPQISTNLPEPYVRLLKSSEREDHFYRMLNESITSDCEKLKAKSESEHGGGKHSQRIVNRFPESCALLRRECEEYIEPLHNRLRPSITAALAAYDAIEQLNRLHAMLDELCTIQEQLFKRKRCLNYVRVLNERMKKQKQDEQFFDYVSAENLQQPEDDDIDAEENNNFLLNAMLAAGNSATTKRSVLKRPRERSKSVITDDISLIRREKELNENQFRRQSTFSEGKSKISKWTKVKAAFKWERANVPTITPEVQKTSLIDSAVNGTELTARKPEEARYLRVPSVPCGGGSSVDSIFSSSSGHALSEIGTPGTVSPISSIDGCAEDRMKLQTDILPGIVAKSSRTDQKRENFGHTERKERMEDSPSLSITVSEAFITSQNKDFQRNPIPATSQQDASSRRSRLPPKPLDLNFKYDMNDSDSSNLLKSPREHYSSASSAINRVQTSNSSVPSSPSRHSDFFPDSEDISSGEISEPTSPYHLERIKFFEKQEEINHKYNILRERLNREFEIKRKNWENIKRVYNGNMNAACQKYEEHPAHLQSLKSNATTKLLEDSLTPDFKKKLQKWRDKKHLDTKTKIDWNLWKTGQIKLEGQGLSPMPEQKDLPEEFQRKLEQWNKMKRGGSICSTGTTKSSGEGSKRCVDDDVMKNRMEKLKLPEKEKTEKLSKLKAIVTDPRAKEIEVKTTAGIMKFEGISRKFTRKLYEWEKARGIGPESSTFALLHPGYCPIDVGIIIRENHNYENSPNLSRSMSLDSVSHNTAPVLSSITHQTSSLSLNDVTELKIIANSDDQIENEFKKFEEPEAVMVEVEDHIVETASSLLPIEQHIPVYKYAETTCNDYCNAKSIQSFKSSKSVDQLAEVLDKIDDELRMIKINHSEKLSNREEMIHFCEAFVTKMQNLKSKDKEIFMNDEFIEIMFELLQTLERLKNMEAAKLQEENYFKKDLENCDKDLIDSMNEALEKLWQKIQSFEIDSNKDMLPDINIISEDGHESTFLTNDEMSISSQIVNTTSTLEATDELSASVDETSHCGIIRTNNNGATKRKFRLRKMDSRQNSKTESDSSDEDRSSVTETPRRTRRKGCRSKQRSLEEDCEDISYVLKLKPGHVIKQSEYKEMSDAQIKNSYTQLLAEAPQDILLATENSNIFVQTKRKTFTALEEPKAIDGIVVVEKCLDSSEVSRSNSSSTFNPNEIRNFSDNKKLCKSLSENYLQEKIRSECDMKKCFRQCYGSYESINSKFNCHWIVLRGSNKVRTPLASDSFRLISKTHVSALSCFSPASKICCKREHLFKKKIEKHQKCSGNAIRKIAKTAFAVDHSQSDNVITKQSPINLTQVSKFENHNLNFSEKIVPHIANKPRTPLSERARRIQQAKEEFLKGTLPIIVTNFNRNEKVENSENWSCHRRSHQNINNRIEENNNLLKSQSVGMIATTSTAAGDGTDSDINTFDSLSKAVSRSERITSKLGLATLASKLKRVKIRKRRDSSSDGGSALGALCKQSMMVDILTASSNLSDAHETYPSEGLLKSKSLHSAEINRNEEVNKSKSDQSIQRKKESYV